VEWLAPIVGLAGVFLGARLAARSGETTWLRDLRIDRYVRLIQQVDEGNRVYDKILEVLATPEAYASAVEWSAAINEASDEILRLSDEVRRSSSELSLFASPVVAERVGHVLDGWYQANDAIGQLLNRMSGAHPAIPEGFASDA
jgi:hypothetical protein